MRCCVLLFCCVVLCWVVFCCVKCVALCCVYYVVCVFVLFTGYFRRRKTQAKIGHIDCINTLIKRQSEYKIRTQVPLHRSLYGDQEFERKKKQEYPKYFKNYFRIRIILKKTIDRLQHEFKIHIKKYKRSSHNKRGRGNNNVKEKYDMLPFFEVKKLEIKGRSMHGGK